MSVLNNIKAIVFDVDDTLYDRNQPYEIALRHFLPASNTIRTEAFSEIFRRRGDEVFDASQHGEITMEEMYIYRTTHTFEDLGMPITDAEALSFQQIYESAQKEITASAILKATLQTLQAAGKYKLGVLTNGPSSHQRDKLSILGLSSYFRKEYVVVSGDLGITKPDVRLFRHAQMCLGENPENIFYIGDHYEVDMVGAANAGWRTLWYHRRPCAMTDEKALVDGIVHTEAEMCEYLLR